jgi:hypothetical protein
VEHVFLLLKPIADLQLEALVDIVEVIYRWALSVVARSATYSTTAPAMKHVRTSPSQHANAAWDLHARVHQSTAGHVPRPSTH